jgi:hypothetical protein
MNSTILHDLAKAHISDLHRQAGTAALSLAACRVRQAPAGSLDEAHFAGSGGTGRPRRRSGAWLRTFVKLWWERGGPRWSAGSG